MTLASTSGRAADVPDAAVWNRYWQFDRIASCFDSAGVRNYDESVAGGWRAFFQGLPNGSRILDLCTGNGAIALIAAEVGLVQGKGFDIVAVDRADIDPPAYVSRHRDALAGITFKARTAVEDLPFPDASFDAVVSQYGIEYSDMERALDELMRVVRPGGRARLVLHAADGIVAADSKRVIDEADFLLETIDLPGTAARCFAAVAAAERSAEASEETHRDARESLRAFESALMATGRRMAGAVDQTMLRNSAAVLFDTFKRHARLDVEQMIAKTDEVRTSIRDHRGRLQALIDAAVTRAEAEAIANRIAAGGAEAVEQEELRSGAGLIGHVVEARFRV
jgi:ubiquinone/menaquinone biosynthesis C-methylase UbiE